MPAGRRGARPWDEWGRELGAEDENELEREGGWFSGR